MKRLCSVVVFCLFLSACSATPPTPPEPKGDLKNVNPPSIHLSQLYTS